MQTNQGVLRLGALDRITSRIYVFEDALQAMKNIKQKFSSLSYTPGGSNSEPA